MLICSFLICVKVVKESLVLCLGDVCFGIVTDVVIWPCFLSGAAPDLRFEAVTAPDAV